MAESLSLFVCAGHAYSIQWEQRWWGTETDPYFNSIFVLHFVRKEYNLKDAVGTPNSDGFGYENPNKSYRDRKLETLAAQWIKTIWTNSIVNCSSESRPRDAYYVLLAAHVLFDEPIYWSIGVARNTWKSHPSLFSTDTHVVHMECSAYRVQTHEQCAREANIFVVVVADSNVVPY